jgi:O-acetyl-ADP-ribose deacetylase (regulator of RNase III)
MIKQVKGNILLSGAAAFAHGIAANDPMNRGLALSLHEQHSSMHKDFHHWCHTQLQKVATQPWWRTREDPD